MNDLAQFVEALRKIWPVARGSLSEVYKPCIRPSCPACARDEKHCAFIFSYRKQGRQRCLYVPRDLVPTLRRALENGRWVEQRMTEIGEGLILAHRQNRQVKRGGSTTRKGKK